MVIAEIVILAKNSYKLSMLASNLEQKCLQFVSQNPNLKFNIFTHGALQGLKGKQMAIASFLREVVKNKYGYVTVTLTVRVPERG